VNAMMHIIDTVTGEKVYIKNIRSLELYFDKIKKTKESYTLIKNGNELATVTRKFLDERTRSRLDSLSHVELKDLDRISGS
jgi:hypothetical protein